MALPAPRHGHSRRAGRSARLLGSRRCPGRAVACTRPKSAASYCPFRHARSDQDVSPSQRLAVPAVTAPRQDANGEVSSDPDDDWARCNRARSMMPRFRGRVPLLVEAAVAGASLDEPLAAGLDESEQRPTRDAVRSVAARLMSGVSTGPDSRFDPTSFDRLTRGGALASPQAERVPAPSWEGSPGVPMRAVSWEVFATLASG
jgi:hypothetical protein